MKSRMHKLIDLAKKNVKQCPWCKTKKSEGYLKELQSEVKELVSAFRKKDFENAKEELGDVIWDAIVLAHICEREGKFSAGKSIERVLKKIHNRKPWLMRGEKVTREEAARIWKEAKRKEKKNKKAKKG